MKIINSFKFSLNKRYRVDLNEWEETIIIFWFLKIYKYNIFKNGKTQIKKNFFQLNKKSKRYFQFKTLPAISVSQKELEEIYGGNKWSIPLNYESELFIKK